MKITALLLALSCAASAAEAPPRTVSVSGSASVKVAPDQVLLTIGVETVAPGLAFAKSENDARVKKVLAALRSAGAEEKSLQTDHVSVEPRYEYDGKNGQRLVGYAVRRSAVATLKDVKKFEGLLSAALEAGANHVHGVDFQTTKLREHRDEARRLAIKAAREKAELLAGELGQKLGRPTAISEGNSRWWMPYGSWGGRGAMMAQNAVQNAGGGGPSSEDSTVALGQISVDADVSVTFELQ